MIITIAAAAENNAQEQDNELVWHLPNDFKRFKDNLFEIYLKISPLSDLDKINKSVEDIVNVETKAIYTHISRVKSAFLKLMDYKFAKHYIIDGESHGSSFKGISILQKDSDS